MEELKKITDLDVAKKLLAIKSSADSRGIQFDLSLKMVRKLLNAKKCFISGVVMNRIAGDENQLTFDRLDNSRGYVDDNVVACSLKMNRLKGDLTVEDITQLYLAINKIKK
jgi:hypothetical protein